jgi:hypothetical protein
MSNIHAGEVSEQHAANYDFFASIDFRVGKLAMEG